MSSRAIRELWSAHILHGEKVAEHKGYLLTSDIHETDLTAVTFRNPEQHMVVSSCFFMKNDALAKHLRTTDFRRGTLILSLLPLNSC